MCLAAGAHVPKPPVAHRAASYRRCATVWPTVCRFDPPAVSHACWSTDHDKEAPIIVEPDISAELDQVYGLYGRDQTDSGHT
jgi:hypothetical protein